MPVGGVAPDLVDQHFQPQRMGAGQQRVEIFQRAEDRVHAGVVRHVVAEILLR
jgi:hypothetical protein